MTTDTPAAKMPTGYCFEFDGTGLWQWSPDDDWPIEIYTPTGDETRLADRRIDDTLCAVFSCPDGKIRAINRVCLVH